MDSMAAGQPTIFPKFLGAGAGGRAGLTPAGQGLKELPCPNPSLCPKFTEYSHSLYPVSEIPLHPPAGLRLEGDSGKGTHNNDNDSPPQGLVT